MPYRQLLLFTVHGAISSLGGKVTVTWYYLIFLALIALYVHLVSRLWRDFGRYEKHFNLFLSAAGVAVVVLGLFQDSLPAGWIREILVNLFGTGGSLLTYIGVLLFLLVVYFPHILRWLDPDSKPQDSGQT